MLMALEEHAAPEVRMELFSLPKRFKMLMAMLTAVMTCTLGIVFLGDFRDREPAADRMLLESGKVFVHVSNFNYESHDYKKKHCGTQICCENFAKDEGPLVVAWSYWPDGKEGPQKSEKPWEYNCFLRSDLTGWVHEKGVISAHIAYTDTLPQHAFTHHDDVNYENEDLDKTKCDTRSCCERFALTHPGAKAYSYWPDGNDGPQGPYDGGKFMQSGHWHHRATGPWDYNCFLRENDLHGEPKKGVQSGILNDQAIVLSLSTETVKEFSIELLRSKDQVQPSLRKLYDTCKGHRECAALKEIQAEVKSSLKNLRVEGVDDVFLLTARSAVMAPAVCEEIDHFDYKQIVCVASHTLFNLAEIGAGRRLLDNEFGNQLPDCASER